MNVITKGKTKNYAIFTPSKANRIYNTNHAMKIADSIQKQNLLNLFPIVCFKENGSLVVYDGQHRLAAAKQLGIEVHYIVVDKLSHSDIAAINANQKGWSNSDFAHHYAERGVSDYGRLVSFVQNNGVPVGIAAQLLGSSAITEGGGARRLGAFKDGTWRVAPGNTALKVVSVMNAIKAAGCKFTRDRSFIKAISAIEATGMFNVERLLPRLEYMPFQKCADWKQYAHEIDKRYNYRVTESAKVPLAFKAIAMFDK